MIYRYPGKPATIISEDNYVEKVRRGPAGHMMPDNVLPLADWFRGQVMLCCSINGHYDIVYPRSYPASAALCQCECPTRPQLGSVELTCSGASLCSSVV